MTDETGREKHDLLSLFMSNRKNLTHETGKNDSNNESETSDTFDDKAIRDITLNFITAARDTTRILLSWFFYEINLEENKNIKEKVIKEIISRENESLSYGNVVPAGLTKQEADKLDKDVNNNGKIVREFRYPYLEACLLETLRLHSPVPWLQRMFIYCIILYCISLCMNLF